MSLRPRRQCAARTADPQRRSQLRGRSARIFSFWVLSSLRGKSTCHAETSLSTADNAYLIADWQKTQVLGELHTLRLLRAPAWRNCIHEYRSTNGQAAAKGIAAPKLPRGAHLELDAQVAKLAGRLADGHALAAHHLDRVRRDHLQ